MIRHLDGAVGTDGAADAHGGRGIGRGIAGRGETEHAVLVAVVHDGERRRRFAQGHAQRNELAAEIEHIGVRVGHLELRAQIAGRRGVVDDADSEGRRTSQPIRHIERPQQIEHQAVVAQHPVAVDARRPLVFPANRINRRGAVIDVIHAALGQARHHGEVGGRETEIAVGARQRHGLERLALVGRVTGGGEADVARPRRRSANQAGHVAAVADAFARLGFGPHVPVHIHAQIRIQAIIAGTDAFTELTAAHLGEAAGNHQVAIALNSGGVNRPRRIVVMNPRQAGELVVSGVHEARVHGAIGVQPGEAEAVRAIDGGECPAQIHGAAQLLLGDVVYRVVRARADEKVGIQRAVGIEPHKAVVGTAIDMGEGAARDDLAVESASPRPTLRCPAPNRG